MAKTIVILGASFGGVSTAHRILKGARTAVKIILVSPNTHLYWNLASIRAIIPGQISDDKIFGEIAPGFKQYGADKFEFVLGSAESVDVENKKVTISGSTGQSVVSFDMLVLATGSDTKEPGQVWKGSGSTEATKENLHNFQKKVKAAKNIHIVGAGSSGVEVTGELAFEYKGQKNITLIASGSHILEGTPASVTKTAMKQLAALKVNVKTSTKVTGSAKTPDGRTELTLSSGEKVTTDLYLPTFGLVPNSSYLPHNLVNNSGFVQVDEYLRVKGTTNTWAVGDISDIQRPQYMNTEAQSIHLSKNIILALSGAAPVKYKIAEKDTLAVPIGRKAGTGHMGGMKLPSFMVNMVKGKKLFLDKMPGIVGGSAFK